ncbi:MAG: hypothetical protein AYL28_003030 [Candidatus Bathyarchaeota archaeon B23]|nr:MAG: hypothetical protein AYL28_003030 [Candidatus Bathyarchaeota archaeon B23]
MDWAKEMAKLLRSGATMLSYNCPECGSPLFRLKSGEIWCARCQRRVVILREGEDESAVVEQELLWDQLEGSILEKLSKLSGLLSAEEEPRRVREIAESISTLLASLQRLRRLKR